MSTQRYDAYYTACATWQTKWEDPNTDPTEEKFNTQIYNSVKFFEGEVILKGEEAVKTDFYALITSKIQKEIEKQVAASGYSTIVPNSLVIHVAHEKNVSELDIVIES